MVNFLELTKCTIQLNRCCRLVIWRIIYGLQHLKRHPTACANSTVPVSPHILTQTYIWLNHSPSNLCFLLLLLLLFVCFVEILYSQAYRRKILNMKVSFQILPQHMVWGAFSRKPSNDIFDTSICLHVVSLPFNNFISLNLYCTRI